MGFDRLAEWGPFRFAASTDSFGVNVPGAVATSPAGSVAAGEDAIVPFVTLVNSFLPIFNRTCRFDCIAKGCCPGCGDIVSETREADIDRFTRVVLMATAVINQDPARRDNRQ
jgi:hypothetical protein